MRCYLCGHICDYNVTGLCHNCKNLVDRNNERVEILSLLKEAMLYCPVQLRERIEIALMKSAPFTRLQTHIKG